MVSDSTPKLETRQAAAGDLKASLRGFAKIADKWFAERPFVGEHHRFFKEFFRQENLARAEWPDIQKLGDHIHALNTMALAKRRAFGQPNYAIEDYRKSFELLARGPGTPEERMRAFLKDEGSASKYLSTSSVTEILGYLHAEDYVFQNQRDILAAKHLGLEPEYRPRDDDAAKFTRFNEEVRPVFEAYKVIVGSRIDVPLGLQVDQFFSWLYETRRLGEIPNPVVAGPQVWLYSPGGGAQHWKANLAEGVAAIAWNELGDLQQYPDQEALQARMLEVYGGDNPSNDLRSCWAFAHEMRRGDLIFAKKGRRILIGAGIVEGDYEHDPRSDCGHQRRKVRWTKHGEWRITREKSLAVKTLTNITGYAQQVTMLKELAGLDGPPLQLKAPKYWWLNCNPSMWRVSEYAVGEKQSYTTINEYGNKRQKYRYFSEITPGDLLIAYETSPKRRVTSLLRLTRGLHEAESGESIEFEVVKHYERQPDWETLKDQEDLEECEPIRSNQGSLFALTDEEAQLIIRLAEGEIEDPTPVYTLEDALDDCYLPREKFEEILHRLRARRNVILQGPPGVGKTYLSRRVAYAFMEVKDRDRVQMIQFHQSYSYEDFVQGFRPDVSGGFTLRDGVFYRFCRQATQDTSRPFVFIIDEINRGNLSKILGELMLLIEGDKRSPEWAVPLAYQPVGEPFYVPENVYIMGLMNTADRGLALVDYALRRRFSFVLVPPAFENSTFRAYLGRCCAQGVDRAILQRIGELNREIERDVTNLGPGFQIGHSYFCLDKTQWPVDESRYRQIIETEVAPLLHEYWFDRPELAGTWVQKLMVPISS